MASGNSLYAFTPQAGEPPSSNYATLDLRNNIVTLRFDSSTAESMVFRGVLPSHYSGGGLTLDLYWMASSATSGAVVWGAAWEENDAGNNDLDADNFGTQSTATSTTAATSGQLTKTTITISHANMGSPAAGDPFRLQIQRVAANGSDTMTGDAELHSLHLKET